MEKLRVLLAKGWCSDKQYAPWYTKETAKE
jgi:hypothetical protein